MAQPQKEPVGFARRRLAAGQRAGRGRMTRVSFTLARTARAAIVLVFASLLAGPQALVASAGSAPASSAGDAQVSAARADQGTSDELGTAPGTGATHRVG